MKKNNFFVLFTVFLFSQMAFGESGDVSEYCNKVSNIAKSYVNYGEKSHIPDFPIWIVENKKRTWFYHAPDEKCKSGTFIIEGDIVSLYKIVKDYGYASYISKDNIETKGWVNLESLAKLNLASYKGNKKHLNVSDFIVTNDEVWIILNESYHLFEQKRMVGEQNYHNFIGGFIFGDYYYKLNQHDYNDFSLVTSNVNYDKKLIGMDDDYVISSITLKNKNYKKLRGVRIGDSVDKIMELYNHIPYKQTDNEIEFSLRDMSMSFELKEGKVSSIDIGIELKDN